METFLFCHINIVFPNYHRQILCSRINFENFNFVLLICNQFEDMFILVQCLYYINSSGNPYDLKLIPRNLVMLFSPMSEVDFFLVQCMFSKRASKLQSECSKQSRGCKYLTGSSVDFKS